MERSYSIKKDGLFEKNLPTSGKAQTQNHDSTSKSMRIFHFVANAN